MTPRKTIQLIVSFVRESQNRSSHQTNPGGNQGKPLFVGIYRGIKSDIPGIPKGAYVGIYRVIRNSRVSSSSSSSSAFREF